ADQRLETRADRAENRTRANGDSAHHAQIAHDAKAWQLKRRRDHVMRHRKPRRRDGIRGLSVALIFHLLSYYLPYIGLRSVSSLIGGVATNPDSGPRLLRRGLFRARPRFIFRRKPIPRAIAPPLSANANGPFALPDSARTRVKGDIL